MVYRLKSSIFLPHDAYTAVHVSGLSIGLSSSIYC